MVTKLLIIKGLILGSLPIAGLKEYQLATILLGCVASTASIRLGLKFHKVDRALSKAVAHDLLAQGIAMIVTTIFAVMSYTNHLPDLSNLTKTSMQWVIFVPCIVTSFRLASIVASIEQS